MTTTITPVYSQWNLPTIDNANANDKRRRADNIQQIQLQQPSLVVSPSDDHSHSHSHPQNQNLTRLQPSPLHLSPHHAYARDSIQTIKSAVSSTRTLRNSGRYAPSVFTFNANWAPAPLTFSTGGASTSTSVGWDQRYQPRANNRTEVAGDGLGVVDVERISHLDFDSDSNEDGPLRGYNDNWHSQRSGYGNLHEEEDDYSTSPGPTPTQARTNPYPYPSADAAAAADTDTNPCDPYATAKLNAAYLASYGYTNGLGYERPPSPLSLSNRSSESTSSPSEYSKFSYRDEEAAYRGLESGYLYENAGNSKFTYPHQSSRNTGARFPPQPPHAWSHSLNKATSALLSSLALDASLRDDPYEAWEALCWDEAAPEGNVDSVNNEDLNSAFGDVGVDAGAGGIGIGEGRREGRVYADASAGRRGGMVGVPGMTTKVPFEDPAQEWREFLSSESLPSLDPPVFAPIYEEDDETEVDVDVGLGVDVGVCADLDMQTHLNLNSNETTNPTSTLINNNTSTSTAIKRTTTTRSASTSESGSRSMTTTTSNSISTVTGGTGGESSEEWISLTGARAQAARARILPSRAFARMDGVSGGAGDLEVHAPLPTQAQMDTSILDSNADACAESSQTQIQQHTRTPVDPILVRTPPLQMAYTEDNNNYNYGVVGEEGTFGVGRESLEQFGIMMEGMVGEEGETAPHYGECERDRLVTSSMSMSIPLPIPMPTTMEGEGISQGQGEGEGEEGRDHPPPYEASVCASGFEMGMSLSVPQENGGVQEMEAGAETASSAPTDANILPERSTSVSTPQPASPHLHPLTRPSPTSTPTPQISLAPPNPSPSPAPASASTLTGHRHDGHERTRSQLTFPTSPTTTNTTSDSSSNSQYSRHSRYGRRQSQSVPTLLTSPHSLHSPISPYSPRSPRSPYSPYSPYSPTSASNETEMETTLMTPSGMNSNSNANMVFASLFSGSATASGMRSTTGSGIGSGMVGGEGIGYSPGPSSASFKGSRAGGVFGIGIGKGECGSGSANGGSRPSSPFSILSPLTPSRSGGFNFNFGHHTSTSSSASQKDKEKEKEKEKEKQNSNSNLRVGARPRGARTAAGTWLSASAAGPYDNGMSGVRMGRVGSGSGLGGNTNSTVGEVDGARARREGWTSAPASSSDFNFYGPVNGGGMGLRVRVSREVIRESEDEHGNKKREQEGRREVGVGERRAKTPGPTPVVLPLPLQREQRKEEWELVEPPLREMSKSTPPMLFSPGPGPGSRGVGVGVGGARNLSTSTFTVFADASSRANAYAETDTEGWKTCSAEDLQSETTFSQHPHRVNQKQNQDQTRNRSSSSVSNANTTLTTNTNTNASNASNSSSKTLQRFASRCGTISRRIGVVAGVGVVSTKDWWRTN